jgi:sugar lactone lactonase YvrE
MGNRTRPPGSGRRGALIGATALALAGVLLASAGARAAPRTSAALYYETHTSTGMLAIDRVNLAGRRTSTQVIALPDVGVFGLAVSRGYIYWVTETAPADRGAIMRATVGGQDVRSLVSGLPAPNSIVAAGGFVYWSDAHAIGRVALNGSHVRRRFLVPPPESGGGVADGLATDGTHLYFSRCTEDAIGRADLNRRQITQQFLVTGPRSCPQGLAVAGDHLYWTQLGTGTIGRSGLDGGSPDGRWLNIHSDQGPFQLAVDAAHVYWTWGGVNGSPAYTGRANANRSHVNRRFLLDSIYPLALAGGA